MSVIQIIFLLILIAGMFIFVITPGIGTLVYIGAGLCVVGFIGNLIITLPRLKQMKNEIAETDEELKKEIEEALKNRRKQ